MSGPSKPSPTNEPNFRLIAKNMTEMVMAYDMQRKLFFANPAAETLTGYSLDELEKAQFICWVHPDDRERMLAQWDPLFEGKAFYDEEYRLITKDGRIKWASASWGPILDDTGRQVGVQGRERDITDRKMAEEILRHSEQQHRIDEERYRAIFENSPFPMWEEDFSSVKRYLDSLASSGVTDFHAYFASHREAVEECFRRIRVLDVNRAARDFYGTSNREELITDLAKIFDEPAWEVLTEEMSVLAEVGSPYRVEFQTRNLKGEERLVNMVVSIVDTPRSDWSRVIVTFADITDRKHLEERLVQSQKMESLGRLAGGIAHDFNNLLTVINGYSDWTLQQMDPRNPLRAGIMEIRNAGERCAEMTRQLLAFSRKQPVKPRPLDLNQFIAESQGVLNAVIGDDIELSFLPGDDVGNIEADTGQMHQVLMNLVVNAREAMPNGGRVNIKTYRSDQFAVLEISDTGHGMDEPTRQHLFEPFFTTKSNHKGTGLGLATVFGIVKFAGGRIDVSSEPGAGTTFTIYLPRTDASAALKLQETAGEFRGHGTVLVVEDREEVRVLTTHLLEELGYRVLSAACGTEAIAAAERETGAIDLLLTDVIMPGMNGREVADVLMPLRPGMKVIFMSGYTNQLLGDSSVPYLQKPFTRSKLIQLLRSLG